MKLKTGSRLNLLQFHAYSTQLNFVRLIILLRALCEMGGIFHVAQVDVNSSIKYS
jgi:hypothetical protein